MYLPKIYFLLTAACKQLIGVLDVLQSTRGSRRLDTHSLSLENPYQLHDHIGCHTTVPNLLWQSTCTCTVHEIFVYSIHYRVTGIRSYHLRRAPSFADARQQILKLLTGKIAVGHDIKNDLKAMEYQHPDRDIRDIAYYMPLRRGSDIRKRDDQAVCVPKRPCEVHPPKGNSIGGTIPQKKMPPQQWSCIEP